IYPVPATLIKSLLSGMMHQGRNQEAKVIQSRAKPIQLEKCVPSEKHGEQQQRNAKLQDEAAERIESALRNELDRLKSALADRLVEVNSFKSTLQGIEARRRCEGRNGRGDRRF